MGHMETRRILPQYLRLSRPQKESSGVGRPSLGEPLYAVKGCGQLFDVGRAPTRSLGHKAAGKRV